MPGSRPIRSSTCVGCSPVHASMNAPVPYVHLASPAVRQCSANSAACWSTHVPVTGAAGPNRSHSRALRRCRRPPAALPGRCRRSRRHAFAPCRGVEVEQQRASGGRHVGGEGAAEPMQHPRVGGGDRRSVADLLAQPDHLRSDEVRVELQAGVIGEEARRARAAIADDLGATVLPDDRRARRQPRRAVPGHTVSPWLASPIAVNAGLPAAAIASVPAADHAGPELLGVELDSAVGGRRRPGSTPRPTTAPCHRRRPPRPSSPRCPDRSPTPSRGDTITA